MGESKFLWSDKYSIGVRVIDNDHRELFAIGNELHEVIETKSSLAYNDVSQLIERLSRYAQGHFHREEGLMAEYGYPDLQEHRKKHYQFVRLIYAIRKIESEYPERLDPRRLLDFVAKWLRHHILKADKEIVPYLKGEYGRRKSDQATSAEESEDDETSTDDEDADTDENLDSKDDELVSISVQVPRRNLETLKRCAMLLREAGEEAHTLERMTDPLSSMTVEEAMKIASIVLKEG